MVSIIERVLEVQRTGSNQLKNDLLSDLKDRAYEVARQHCRRYGREPSDEEYSIAMQALNDAIDTYDLKKNSKFETFAYRVITLKLIDLFREEKKSKEFVAYDNEKITLISDLKSSSEFRNKEASKDLAEQRKEELLRFQAILRDLGYSWTDIMQNRPKHQDSLETIREIALYIVGLGLGERFLEENPFSRKLTKLIVKERDIKRRTLVKYRPYLCALIIICIHDFPVLRDYLDFFKKEVGRNESQRGSDREN